MFALPHHQERIRATEGSSNVVKDVGCQPNLHGVACPVCVMLLLLLYVLCSLFSRRLFYCSMRSTDEIRSF